MLVSSSAAWSSSKSGRESSVAGAVAGGTATAPASAEGLDPGRVPAPWMACAAFCIVVPRRISRKASARLVLLTSQYGAYSATSRTLPGFIRLERCTRSVRDELKLPPSGRSSITLSFLARNIAGSNAAAAAAALAAARFRSPGARARIMAGSSPAAPLLSKIGAEGSYPSTLSTRCHCMLGDTECTMVDWSGASTSERTSSIP